MIRMTLQQILDLLEFGEREMFFLYTTKSRETEDLTAQQDLPAGDVSRSSTSSMDNVYDFPVLYLVCSSTSSTDNTQHSVVLHIGRFSTTIRLRLFTRPSPHT
ncbi:hypothetical protein KCU65_g6324, partial [Aureobasidium melanogenum]